MSKVHTPTLASVLKSYVSVLSQEFAVFLDSSGKGLNFVSAITLHPARLLEFPLVAISIYFTSFSPGWGRFGWNKL